MSRGRQGEVTEGIGSYLGESGREMREPRVRGDR